MTETVDRRPPGAVEPLELPARDDFDTATLRSRWVSVRRPSDRFASLVRRPGWLTLIGSDVTLDSPVPVFLGRRQQHHRFRARTVVEVDGDGEIGLAAAMDESAHYEVAAKGDRVLARARIGPLASVVGEAPRPPGPVKLVIETQPSVFGPDVLALAFEDIDGILKVLAELDGCYLSTQVVGGLTGRLIGLYAAECDAAFDWFDYEKTR